MTTAPDQKTSTSTALAPHTDPAFLARMNGTTREPAAIARMLDEASRHLHLVSPATSVGAIPEGFTVVTSVVKVDVERDTYAIPGSSDRGLSKVSLDRIALTAGISADPRQSRRLDDGKDPRYVHYRWVGTYQTFDGSTIEISAEKVLDMRDKSPAVEALWSKYREKLADWERGGKQGAAPKSPESSSREVRLHLLSHAQTKARNRALRSGLGLRTAYSRAELAKPFVVAKIAFTGQTDDPTLRREFAKQMMQAHFGAREKLYGPGPEPYAQLPPGEPAPPVGSVVDPDDDGVIEAEFETAPVASPSPPRSSVPAETPTPVASAGGTPPSGWLCRDCGFDNPGTRDACGQCDFLRDEAPSADAQGDGGQPPPADDASIGQAVMKFGRSKGKRLRDAHEDDVRWYRSAIVASIDDPEKAKWREANMALVVEIDAELARRGS